VSDTFFDLNDSELLRLEEVVKVLNQRQGKSLSIEAFRKEAIERFAIAGFKVDVKTYTTTEPGVYAFDIDVQDRYEGEFDPERQVHEVTNDLLELGTKGTIKTEQTSSGLHVVGGKSHAGHKH
jgi:hypothetical protein